MSQNEEVQDSVAIEAGKTVAKPRLVAREGKPTSTAGPLGAASPGAGQAAPGAGLLHLITIEGSLRQCRTRQALWTHLANEPVVLLPFGQALVFEPRHRLDRGKQDALHKDTSGGWHAVAVSALAAVNRDAPMLRWYEDLAGRLWSASEDRAAIECFTLPTHADPQDPCTAEAALRHLMWVPVADAGRPPYAGWLLARDTEWEDTHRKLAARVAQAYAHGASAIEGRAKPSRDWPRRLRRLGLVLALIAAVLAFVPVPLTTLAPVEVTPKDPFVVAAPVAGVVERILVEPGAQVKTGDPLVQLVDTTLRSDSEVAQQKLEVARAKMLRLQQASMDDNTAKRELAIAQSEETVARAERDYAQAMFAKAVIKAQQPGVALYGDPRDWVGRPVVVGEAIMRVADPAQVEFQLKVPVADAVNLREGAQTRVFLDASPLHPLDATIVRAAYKAETDPAGVASYVVTARAVDASGPVARLGLRGTARVYGERVTLFFYLLRRPITAVRQWTGM
ncbi:HlyD family efflux transporter periplasmic adaptor subunit [Variovorax sp. dw_954]|uniref:efflux RND transporter periplasmic adaptor subunit n=1 Tax=Variovorax sp. dw_954 TaxID=2720078 RepID=UPI001BD27F5F|nr:HlyD family efflux transporter periplasmic adaptor subunit [Variovorax sp. dw_954]